MAVASVSQKSSCASLGRASVRPCRVARTPVVLNASKKNHVESAMQAVGAQAVSAALAMAIIMAPAPAQALLPFKQSYQNQLDNAVSSVQNKVSSDINNTKGKAQELKSTVDNKLGNPLGAFGNAAKSTGNKIKANLPLGSVPNVGNKVSSDINNTKGKVQEVKSTVDNKLGNPADALGSAAESTLSKIKANLPLGTLPDVGSKVSSDIQNTKSKALDVKSNVDNKLNNPVDAVGAKANSALEKIKSVIPIATLPDVRDKVSNDINNTKSAALDVKSKVDNKLGNPVDALGAKASSTFDKIKANLPLGTLPDVGSKVQSDINTTQNKANEVKGVVQNQVQGNNASDALGDAANAAKGAFDNLKNGLPLGNIASGNGQGTGEGVAAGKAKEQQTQSAASQAGEKVKDFVLGTSYGNK